MSDFGRGMIMGMHMAKIFITQDKDRKNWAELIKEIEEKDNV